MSLIISSAGQQFVAGGGGGGGSGEGFPLTSDVSAAGFRIQSLGDAAAAGDAVSRGFADARYLRQNGSTPLTANWDVGGFRLENVAAPNSDDDAVNRGSMTAAIAAAVAAITGYVKTDGTTPMTAAWNFGGFNLTNVAGLAVGTNTLGASAALQVDSTTRGLLVPRMTTGQRDAIAAPAEGLLVYVATDSDGFSYYNGVAWAPLAPEATGFLREDGTTPLTGEWDVGAQGIVNVSQLAVGTAAPGASAALQVDSTVRGYLPPRMTTTQRNAIAAPATGLQLFNTTTVRPEWYTGAAWLGVASSLVVGETGATAVYRGGSRLADIEAVSSSVTLSVAATQHDVDTTSARALALPTAATVGDVHVVSDVTGGAGTNNITMTDQGGGTINGAASYVMSTAYAGRSFRKTAAATWVSST